MKKQSLDTNDNVVRAPAQGTAEFDLAVLVEQITDRNRHDEISTGLAVGAEFC